MNAELLTALGQALGCTESCTRPSEALPQYFRADQAKLDRERAAWALIIQESIDRYRWRFTRIARERMLERRARRQQ